MTSIIVILLFVFIIYRNTKKKQSSRTPRKDTARKGGASKNSGKKSQTSKKSAQGHGAGTVFGIPRKAAKPQTDLYKLEDRDNDWLARQIREEAQLRNSLDREISAVKLKRRLELERASHKKKTD